MMEDFVFLRLLGPGAAIPHLAPGFFSPNVPPPGRDRAEGEEMTARAENSGKLWTAQEDERLRELAASSATPSEIAAKLNRTEAATKARAYTLRVGLRRFRARRRDPVEMGLKAKAESVPDPVQAAADRAAARAKAKK